MFITYTSFYVFTPATCLLGLPLLLLATGLATGATTAAAAAGGAAVAACALAAAATAALSGFASSMFYSDLARKCCLYPFYKQILQISKF